MAGLLDFTGSQNSFTDDPTTMGLLNAAAQLFQAGGPSRTPTSFGQALGAGLGGYTSGFQGVQDRKAKMLHDALLAQGLKLDLQGKQQSFDDATKQRQAMIDYTRQKAAAQSMMPPAQQPPAMQAQDDSMVGLGSDGQTMGSPYGTGAAYAPAPSQQQQAPAPQMRPQQSPIQARIDDLNAQADFMEGKGIPGDAYRAKAIELEKMKPKFSTSPQGQLGPDGKLHSYVFADNGTFQDTGLGVKPDMAEMDLGGTKQFVDKNAVMNGQSFTKTQDANSKASNALGYARLAFDKKQAEGTQDAVMDPLAVRMTAQQYLAGDSGALQNFGRGAQGAQNLNAVRLEIAKQANAAGLNGSDIAAKMAEFGGIKAGQRTAGTRSANIEIAANEVNQLAPLALDASKQVVRSGFLPFGKAEIMFDTNTNNIPMRQFAMANTALVNAYGQAMARNGTATVSDKEHAREMLSTAFDQPSYEGAVAQLYKETKAAQAAPQAVKKDISNMLTGRGATETQAPQPRAVTLKDIQDTANASGKTTAEVTAALRAKGYTIGGQ